MIAPDFEPSLELFNELESAGFSRNEFLTPQNFFAGHTEVLKALIRDLGGRSY